MHITDAAGWAARYMPRDEPTSCSADLTAHLLTHFHWAALRTNQSNVSLYILNFERNITVYLCLTVLAISLAIDLVSGRIPRIVSTIGLLLSQIYVLTDTGSVILAMRALLWGIMILVILYPVFAIGGIGAGDIKLMMMLPGFMGIGRTVLSIALSFFICAACGILLLIWRGDLLNRLTQIKNYINATRLSGRISRYEDFPSGPGATISSNRIHFTIPLLAGAILTYGGLIRS